MNENAGTQHTMKLYCTTGRGTELFAAEELMRVFGQDTKITSTDGKSYFIVNESEQCVKQKLMSLKTVERVFVMILHEQFQKLDRRGLLTLLHTKLNNKDAWDDCISTLKLLSKSGQESQHCFSSVNRIDRKHSVSMGVDRIDSTIKADSTVNVDSKIKTDTVDCTIKVDSQNKAISMIKVDSTIKVDSIMKADSLIKVDSTNTVDSTLKADRIHPKTDTHSSVPQFDSDSSASLVGITSDLLKASAKCVPKTGTYITSDDSIQDIDIDTDISKMNKKRGVSEDGIGASQSQADYDTKVSYSGINDRKRMQHDMAPSINDTEVNDVTCITKRRKLDRNSPETFRVSCRFSGFARKQLNIQRTSQQMGVLISKLLGWKINLQHPKYEINIHLGDDTLTVGIPIIHTPLSKRSYIKHCGLRTPVAWIMADLLGICPGDVVLDPMCGSGTLLLEASQICQNAVFIGMDKNISQLHLAAENIVYNHQRTSNLSLIHGDTRHIPLPDSCIDSVVTDAPFGQNYTVTGSLHVFYSQMLYELARVVKPAGKVVLLTSTSMVDFVTQSCDGTVTYSSPPIEHKSSDSTSKIAMEKCVEHTTMHTAEDITEICGEVDSIGNSKNSKSDSDFSTRDFDVTEINTKSKYSNICSEGEGREIDSALSSDHLPLTLKATYNVKLGETEGCILVMQNSEKLKL